MSRKVHTDEDTAQLRVTIGPRIKAARRAMRLTQTAAANRSGISPEFFARMERGHGMPSVCTLKKIADALGVTVDHLFGMDGADGLSTPPLAPHVQSKDSKRVQFIVDRARTDPELRRLVNAILKLCARTAGISIEDEDEDD